MGAGHIGGLPPEFWKLPSEEATGAIAATASQEARQQSFANKSPRTTRWGLVKPYMTREDAREIIENVLAAYKTHHKTLPARVIVLKTSRFKDEEADGIQDAQGRLPKGSLESHHSQLGNP